MPIPLTQARARHAATKSCARLLGALLLAVLAGEHSAAQVRPASQLTAYVTIASDARSRGLSQLYGESTSWRLGVDLDLPARVFAGASLGNVGYAIEQAASRPRERLAELYAGYVWDSPRWSVTALLAHYRYPGSTLDYDYSELTGVVGYGDRFFYQLAYMPDYLSLGYSAVSHELGITWPLPAGLELSASIGTLDADGFLPGYTYHDIGISKLLGPFSVDLRRYDTSRDIVGLLGSSYADRWVLSVSYGINLRD